MISLSLISFGQNYKSVIKTHLTNNLEKFNLLQSDIDEWKITNQVYSDKTKITHVYIQQLYKGIPVFNAVSNISIRESDNEVIFSGNSFIKNLALKVNKLTPTLKPEIAITQAASALHLGTPNGIQLLEEKEYGNYLFSKSGVSQEKIPVELVFQPLEDGTVKLSWLLNIHQLDGIHWWNVRIDANSGVLLQKNDWGVSCNFDIETGNHSHDYKVKEENKQSPLILIKKNKSLFEVETYNVFALPVESPNHGSRTLLSAPHNTNASPFGWHDVDGIIGAEYTTTRGNNVYAQLDDDGFNDTFGDSPDGGSGLVFDFRLNLDNAPLSYKNAAITNLFYMSNAMHDIWYQYGFDEPSGNFQAKNYKTFEGSELGQEDEVIADAQDSGGKNNANFATPPNGFKPRMQMFLWDNTSLIINSGSLAGKYSAIDANFTEDGTGDTDSTGAPVATNPVTADLVLMNDGDRTNPTEGCSTSGLSLPSLAGKIVVIRRGNCSFVSKVQLAQDNNAVGVIIVNNDAGTVRMGGATTTISIPSVSVTQELGEQIIAALQNSEVMNVKFSGVDLDGSFENGIIAHEYGHGISNRLIGGASNSNCMNNDEQLGEGWSDYFAVAITMKSEHTETTSRGIGTYITGEPVNGRGIRRYPYTTDMAVNPFTFNNVKDQELGDLSVSVHGVGSIWATMLWDLNWKMIGIYGFDPDMYNGTGGNNKTMALVIEGLKLTPCSSGFVGARDAILAADQTLYGGVNQCAIWEVFARRGLGYSASSGDPSSFRDQVEAFDMPPEEILSAAACNSTLNLNNESLKAFKVYPNPTNSYINISLVNEIKNATIAIYDINGRQVYFKKSDLKGTEIINTEILSNGIYILKINNTEVNYSEKLIIN
ncbi:MAG: T9SS-dependent M36 family metallopeptidase [Polaribacter sp.]|uniref:T9SS-dependent M36 family metallopeptidase n=1 Tax=Polaribacter sp. TaxID=1920175 RepID=UPI003BB0BBA3